MLRPSSVCSSNGSINDSAVSFNDSDNDRTPTFNPSSSEITPLVPRTRTFQVSTSSSSLGVEPPMKRAHTAPSKSTRGPPRETTEFICYAIFRIWHRLPPGADIPNSIFFQLTNITHDLLTRTGVGMSCLLMSLLYIARLRNATPDTEKIQMGSEYRVFVCALIMAQKWLKDDRLSNSYWARASTVPVEEINTMERHFLGRVEWNLNASSEEFEKWKKAVKLLGGEHAARIAKIKIRDAESLTHIT